MQLQEVKTNGKSTYTTSEIVSDTGGSKTVLDGIRLKLFLDRYSYKDENGNPTEKTPEEMWRRVSRFVASAEKTKEKRSYWESRFFDAMKEFRFCPGGRFLTAAGTGTEATMINCYVIPNPEDTRHGIIKTLEQMTEISARGGGVGFNISTLRPNGTYLKTVNGTTSGAVSWASLYSIAAHDIIQHGGTRRGALMIMMWDWHPDIEEFITVKKTEGKMAGANLSVCVSDEFMEAVKKDADWQLMFPDTSFPKYKGDWDGDLAEWKKKGYPVKTYKTIKARYLWDMICESAWASAEPGVVFMDRYNQMNNSWYFEKNIATNPCGEQGLPAWGVCNLASINLAAFVKDGEFDFQGFKEIVSVGVRFLDNAIDTEKYLYKEIESTQKNERRLGLGTMGLADALIKMKIRYGSEESYGVIENIFKTLRDTAYDTSVGIAKEKGSFPKFDAKKFLMGGFVLTLPDSLRLKIKKYGIRNAFLVTEAPTGKISLLAGVSSGIEPVFSFTYVQKDRLGERTMHHPLYKEWLDSGEQKRPDYFVVADDLTPEEHVRIQSLIQKYTDSSISKTVNAPQTHTVSDVKKLYEMAYESGCKGISYMRDGSREGTLVRGEKKKENTADAKVPLDVRPLIANGSTYRLETPVGIAFITINETDEKEPLELFINVGKAGSDVQAMAQALGRTISAALRFRSNVGPKARAMEIAKQLAGIGGRRSVGFGPTKVLSLPDAVACAISLHFDFGINGFQKKNLGVSENSENAVNTDGSDGTTNEHGRIGDICPSCGSTSLVFEEGCSKCYSCGHSEC